MLTTLLPVLVSILALVILALCFVGWPFFRVSRNASESIELVARMEGYEEKVDSLSKAYIDNELSLEEFNQLKYELKKHYLFCSAGNDSIERRSERLHKNPTRFSASLYIILTMTVCIGLSFSWYMLDPQTETQYRWLQSKAQLMPLVSDYVEGNEQAFDGLENLSAAEFFRAMQAYLQLNPGNAEVWFALGRSLQNVEALAASENAFRRAFFLRAEDSVYAMAYANVRLLNARGKLDDESRGILENVLKKTPDHEGALMLLGLAGFQSGNFELALNNWQKLMSIIVHKEQEVSSSAISSLQKSIDIAKKELLLQKSIELTINLDASFAVSAFLPQSMLYVYAKPLSGSKAPVAVKKIALTGSFPILVQLGDQDALMPTKKLSNFDDVILQAHISLNGAAIKQSGDYEAEAKTIQLKRGLNRTTLLIEQITE